MVISSEYLAGIMDGEGTIRVRREKGRYKAVYNYHITIQICNCFKPLIDQVQRDCGGRLYVSKRFNRRPLYTLDFGIKDGIQLLKMIMPFLIIKKEQAQLCLALPHPTRGKTTTSDISVEQEYLYERVRLLNKVGVVVK